MVSQYQSNPHRPHNFLPNKWNNLMALLEAITVHKHVHTHTRIIVASSSFFFWLFSNENVSYYNICINVEMGNDSIFRWKCDFNDTKLKLTQTQSISCELWLKRYDSIKNNSSLGILIFYLFFRWSKIPLENIFLVQKLK